MSSDSSSVSIAKATTKIEIHSLSLLFEEAVQMRVLENQMNRKPRAKFSLGEKVTSCALRALALTN